LSIILIRHGETASNAARVLQFPDTPLSERGLAQARAVAKRFANAKPVYCTSAILVTYEAAVLTISITIQLRPSMVHPMVSR
jgi:broad specificity phosphatase PhoE